jgi:response regulator of citrate/malate metabolism
MTATLLIADDNPAKIALLQKYLDAVNWDAPVLIAETSDDAMTLIDSTPTIGFGLIDFYIPSQNGPAIIRYLKTANPSARIALVSSGKEPRNLEEAKMAGAETSICTHDPAQIVERDLTRLLKDWKVSL